MVAAPKNLLTNRGGRYKASIPFTGVLDLNSETCLVLLKVVNKLTLADL